MLNDRRLHTVNALMLQWHAGAPTIGFEAFQAWVLMTLKPRLSFDGAIWGLVAEPDATSAARVTSVHLHRIAERAMHHFERVRLNELTDEPGAGQVTNLCLTDPEWQGETHAALREHAQEFGMNNSISMGFVDTNAPGRQFVILTRSAAGHRFTAEEAGEFALLAPHMMQAYATRRRLLLDSSQATGRRIAGLAVAMVDRTGVIHDHHAGFVPMLRREWSDWSGARLPEPLRELMTRRAGAPWRFLGQQVCAEFVPVDDLYLMTARPRHVADPLTPRESEVARRYAAGGNFREIAAVLQLSPATVRSHLRNVFGKMHVRSKAQLASLLH